MSYVPWVLKLQCRHNNCQSTRPPHIQTFTVMCQFTLPHNPAHLQHPRPLHLHHASDSGALNLAPLMGLARADSLGTSVECDQPNVYKMA